MLFSATHRRRFKQDLATMHPNKLVKLGVDTRRKRDTSHVGVATQLVAAIPSQGASLIATAVWSGPRSGYYGYKHRTVKKALQERGLALPPRRFRDIAIPATVGAVTAVIGAGADGFDGVVEQAELFKSQLLGTFQDEGPAVGALEWLANLWDAVGGTATNHVQVLEQPAMAVQLLAGDYASAYNVQDPEGLHEMAEQLEKALSMVLPGGEPLFSAESAKLFGSVATSIAIGEAAGKGIEKLFPNSTTASNGERRTGVQDALEGRPHPPGEPLYRPCVSSSVRPYDHAKDPEANFQHDAPLSRPIISSIILYFAAVAGSKLNGGPQWTLSSIFDNPEAFEAELEQNGEAGAAGNGENEDDESKEADEGYRIE